MAVIHVGAMWLRLDIFDRKEKSILLKIGVKQNFVSNFRNLYLICI